MYDQFNYIIFQIIKKYALNIFLLKNNFKI